MKKSIVIVTSRVMVSKMSETSGKDELIPKLEGPLLMKNI